jgi:Cys-tRNA synthase (O-phospho-L-seryl-tRNA:Cys-tRNA synthase)
MKYYELKSSLRKSNVVESIRSYRQLIEKTEEGKILINGLNTEFKTIEEARKYIKEDYDTHQLADKIAQDTYQEISENTVASIIKEHHDIKVTDTLIESYVELASSHLFSVDPVVHKIRSLNKLDRVVEGKLHYVLSDESTVAINEDTQDILNKLLNNQTDIVEYMRESKENFFRVLEQIEE